MGAANSAEAKAMIDRVEKQNQESRECRAALEAYRGAVEKQTAETQACRADILKQTREVQAYRAAVEQQTHENAACRAALEKWQGTIDSLVRQASHRIGTTENELRASQERAQRLVEQLTQDAAGARGILQPLEEQYARVPKPPVERFAINGHLIDRDDLVTAEMVPRSGWYDVVVVLKNGSKKSILQNMIRESAAIAWINRIFSLMESPRKHPLPPTVIHPVAAAAAPATKVPGGPPAYDTIA